MKMQNIPSEYAIVFLIVVAVVFIVLAIAGTSKLSSDLDEIGSFVDAKSAEMEK